MEGIKPISMLLLVSVMAALGSARQEEGFEEQDFSSLNFFPDQAALVPPETLLPPGTPLPPGIPSIPGSPFPPETPSFPGNRLPPQLNCEDNCALKCSKLMLPLLTNICLQVCKMKCKLLHSELLYNCTNNCAHSMPAGLMSDEENTQSYVNSCYKKCMKND